MKRALVLAYHFPPIGGIGPGRVLGVTRRLRQFGYEPIVITGSGQSSDRFAPIDKSLESRVSEGLEVIRIDATEPVAESSRRRARSNRLLARDDAFTRWWTSEALRTARLAGPVNVIWAYMRPYASVRVAAQLARERDVPWVADLTDPWALDETAVYPTSAHRALDLRRMRVGLASAAAVVTSAPEVCRQIVEHFPEFAGRVSFNGYGYEEAAFSQLQPARQPGPFRIVHAGTLHTDRGRLRRGPRDRVRRLLGGQILGVNILTRSHVFLVEAIEQLLASDGSLAGDLEAHFAGPLTRDDLAAVESLAFVRMLGPLSHAASVELMRGADLLFLPMHELEAGARARIIPGKTYDYLASRTPVLGAVPPGDAREILTRAGNALLCAPGDLSGIRTAIAGCIERWRAGVHPADPQADLLELYAYTRVAERLAAVFDCVLAGHRISPGPMAEVWIETALTERF